MEETELVRNANGIFLFRALALLVLVISVPAEAVACRLALVLAIDVSKSVDPAEYDLQSQGLANAFRDKKVRAALMGYGEPVAAAAFHWSGEGHQAMVADWLLFMKHDDIDRFAERIGRHQRSDFVQRTAIGSALTFAKDLLARGPDCAQQVIDVSGDGYQNEGLAPLEVYEDLDFSEITVNALVVGGLARPELKLHFVNEVIHGPGAFALATQSFADYADAIRQKLLRELAPRDMVASAEDD